MNEMTPQPAASSPIAASPGAATSPVESSLTMVPVPWATATVALTGLARLTKKVSFGSTVVSPLTVTATVLAVSPAANVSVVSGTAT